MKQSTREWLAIGAAIGTFVVCATAGPQLTDEGGTLADFIILTGTITLSVLAYMGVMRS